MQARYARVDTKFPELQGPLTLRVGALQQAGGDAPVSVVTDPGISSPQLTVRGSQEDLDQVSLDTRAGRLGVSLPGSSGGGINITGGTVIGNISGGAISIGRNNSISIDGDMHIGGVSGRTIVNGVDVTDYVPATWRSRGARADVPRGPHPAGLLGRGRPQEPSGAPRWQFRGIDVHNHTGDIQVQGEFGAGRVQSHTGSISVGSVTGNANLRTHTGNIHVEHADPANGLDMRTHTGNVIYRVGSLDALNKIQGRTHTGNVTHGTSARASAQRPQNRQQERPGERGSPHRGRFDGRSW
ncbi:MAG: hypothetical protein GEV07_07405 [Streptosporangiales bacterium]|nr:hypothetical protein [Streptosporangiales bacterium]